MLKGMSLAVPEPTPTATDDEISKPGRAEVYDESKDASTYNSKATSKLENIRTHRKRSVLDGCYCRCFTNKWRNLCMFISIGVFFFIMPVLMLGMAFATQFSSTTKAATETADTEGDDATNNERLL